MTTVGLNNAGTLRRIDLDTYMEVLNISTNPFTGVCGRIIRGRKPGDFETLTDDPDRKIVMLVDPEGLRGMLGKNGYEMLLTVGYDADYLEHKVKEGNQFKMVIFQEGGEAKLATWDNVFDLVKAAYPGIGPVIDRSADALKATPFAEIESQAGFKFLDVEKLEKNKADPRFMTYERLLRSRGTLADVRAFLYFTVHLREQFSGDGWTKDGNGNNGVQEFIILNKPLAELGDYRMVDIDVKIPEIQMGFHMGLVTAPSFWNPRNVFDPNYRPNFERAREEGRKLGLRPVHQQIMDGDIHMSLSIDNEKDFADYYRYVNLGYLYGRLPVTGALEDAVRWGERIIKGTYEEFYTHHMVTFDKHPTHVIHGNSWWADEDGNPPDVTLPVRMKLVDPDRGVFLGLFVDGSQKYFYPTTMRKWTVDYWKHLKASGQVDENGDAFIWVFTAHCREGTDGVELIPAIAEVYEWACAARRMQMIYLYKGMIAETDWFGPFEPCRPVPTHPQGSIQTTYLDYFQGISIMYKGQPVFKETQSVDIGGQAEDFCVEAGTQQMMKYYAGKPDVLQRFRFVTDCTSAIFPDSPKVLAFRKQMRTMGVQLVRHNDPLR